MKYAATLALGATLLVGCAQSTLTARTSPGGALVLTPRVEAGAYRAQAVISPYGEGDIDHLRVQVFTVSGGSESPVLVGGEPLAQDLPGTSLGGSLVFNGLHSNTTYRVRAYAYSAPGTASVDLISLDSASYRDIEVATNERPTAGSLPIQLIDKAFAATSSVRITVSPAGSTHHVSAILYRKVGDNWSAVPGATGSIPVANLPATFNLDSLGANATYRLIAAAEDAANSVLNSGYFDVVTTTNTSAPTGSIAFSVAPS